MSSTMRVVHSSTLLRPQSSDKGNVKSVRAACWTNDGHKAAVCRPDNIIQLYDGEGCARDKFHTRPRDAKENPYGYHVTAMSFSPDGCNLAIGQSDGIVFIFKIGDFKEKKSISNKFPQPCPVTAVEWANQSELFIGLLDGKIRMSHHPDRKLNKVTLVHGGESAVVRLVANSVGTELAASFMEGKIILFSIGEMEPTVARVCIRHARPATALCIGPHSLIAGGSDRKLVIYEKKSGKVKQTFDYSKDASKLDMAWCAMNTAGNALITASSKKLKVYLLNLRTKKWEEGKEKECPQIYHPTCLALRRDGTYLTIGTCAGSCEMFELIYKRTKNQKIDVNYISPSHVVVTVYPTNQRVTLRSKYHNEILDVKLMGKDRYVVARTPETMFIADIEEDSVSEITWSETEDTERFYFGPTVCMIFNRGELSLLEYGRGEILGTYRTSVINPRVISVRINERISNRQMQDGTQNKRMAYLLDYKTIQIVDLEFVINLGSIMHRYKINWMDLNETGTKLIFRDKRSNLTLYDVNTSVKYALDRSCGFVKWVPGCDVIVCQSGKQLRIWYNMDAPDISVDQNIRGVATEIVRQNEQSVVVLKEGNRFIGVPLDENRIQFSAALELGNLSRATYFLDESRPGPDLASMWSKLGRIAALNCDPRITLKAFAAVDDIPKARYLSQMIRRNSVRGGENYHERRFWKSDYSTKANMHLLIGDFREAENILFDHGDIDAAIDMFSALHKFDEVIELVKTKHSPKESAIVQEFVEEWYYTEQYDMLGIMAERIGRPDMTVSFFIEAGYPNRAAPYALKYPNTLQNPYLSRALSEALVKKDFIEDAGKIYEATGQYSKALVCFRRTKLYDKAVNLARNNFQYDVVPLEEEWGDYLMFSKQYDVAANHYIEAGCTLKALEATMKARQYKKAAQIIGALDITETVAKYYVEIGEYFKENEKYREAEKCFLRGRVPKKAVDMYTQQGRWEDGYRVTYDYPDVRDQVHNEYLEHARVFETEGRLGSAENVLLVIDEVDLIISMYAKAKRYDEVLRLVETHHPEHANDTKVHLAEVLVGEDNFKAAEEQYVRANTWESAVQMYESRRMWEDSVRVAKNNGGPNACRQVIFRWARSLPVKTSVKLLNKYGKLEECIEFNCLQGDFKMAESLAEIGAQEKLPDVHLVWGQFLEERRNYVEAKMHYLKANKARLAIDMLIEAKDIQDAISTADKHAKEELPRVLVMYAKQMFAQKLYPKFEAAMLRAERVIQAIEMYKSNGMWTEALKMSKEFAPQFLSQLTEEHRLYQVITKTMAREAAKYQNRRKESDTKAQNQRRQSDTKDQNQKKESDTKVQNQIKEPEPPTVEEQLNLLCEKNMWKQCLEQAKTNNELFAKYLAKYVTHLAKTRSPRDALEVYVSEYGPLIHKLHLNLYRALATLIINDMEHDDFDTWKNFRDVMFNVCFGLKAAGFNPNSKTYILMENYMWVMHLMAAKSVFKTFPQLEHLAAKIAVSLLRFTRIVNPERAFFEAATLCKQVKLDNNAFVFFNFYMDIHDAVVAGMRTTGDLDHTDLFCTDIPRDVDLQSRIVVPPAWREKAKDWVLAMSMDSPEPPELTIDERGVFEGSLAGEGKIFEPCVVTGYPVLYNRVTFRPTNKYANKEDWNRFLITYRGENKDPRLDNVILFIEKWAGPCPSYF